MILCKKGTIWPITDHAPVHIIKLAYTSMSIIDQHDRLYTVSLHSLQCSLININSNPPPLGNASVWVMVLISVHLVQHQAEANGDKYNTLSHFLGRSWWAVGRLYTFWVNTGRVYGKCKYMCPHGDHGPWPTAVNWACVLWFWWWLMNDLATCRSIISGICFMCS